MSRAKRTTRFRGFSISSEGSIEDGRLTLTHLEVQQFGVCRVCGCTDDDCRQCIERTGAPCSWVDELHTLCSACA